MTTKTSARKASPKTANPPQAAKPKALPAVPPKKAATAALPATTPSLTRRPSKARAPVVFAAPREPVGTSKQASLIALLSAQPGATIEQMTALTGWQPHTVRGTISGVLRKRLGLKITCAAPDASGQRLYRISA